MSGASRRTFETVITDTPARSAMSFNRTINSMLCPTLESQCPHGDQERRCPILALFPFLDGRTAPVQFLPERFKKGITGQTHQAHATLAAPYRDRVAGGQLNLLL